MHIQKRVIFLLFIFFSHAHCLRAQAPCEVSIPSDAVLIRKNAFMELIAKDQTYWVCNESKVIFRAGRGVMIIDQGSILTLAKGEFVVYLRRGAKLNIGLSVRGIVYAETGAELPTYSSSMQIIPCHYLAFDYTQAPKGICPEIKTEIPPALVQDPQYAPYSGNSSAGIPQENNDASTQGQTQPNVQSSPDYAESDAHIIPPDANVMQTGVFELKKTGNQSTYWICERTNYQHTGNHNVFYVEAGSSFTLYSGSDNIIYLKENTKISLGVGTNNQVYYIGNPELKQDRSRDTRFTKLSHLSFDYSQAPVEGCK